MSDIYLMARNRRQALNAFMQKEIETHQRNKKITKFVSFVVLVTFTLIILI